MKALLVAFVAAMAAGPALAAEGYRVANVDIRGCGDSSLGWDGYSRTDISGDLVSVVRHLGGPAVIIGQSISGGAATIAAATAPDVITGVIELAPFTRVQPFDLGGLIRVRRFRAGYTQMALVIVRGRLANWLKYLDVAVPVKRSADLGGGNLTGVIAIAGEDHGSRSDSFGNRGGGPSNRAGCPGGRGESPGRANR